MENSILGTFFLENGSMYGTFIVGFLSGFLPIVNLELYLIALITLVVKPKGYDLCLISFLAAMGQVCAKVTIYKISSGALNLRMPARLDPAKIKSFSEKFMNKGIKSDFIMGSSAFFGIPPILITSFVAGFARYPLVKFIPIALGGRWMRFYICVLFPEFVKHPPWS